MKIIVDSEEKTMSFIEDLDKTEYISLDIETSGLNEFEDYIKLIQIKLNNNIYVIINRRLEIKYIIMLLELINNSNKKIIGHNIDFDLRFIYNKYNVLLLNTGDTQICETLINNGHSYGTAYSSLKDLVEKYIGVSLNKEIRDKFIGDTPITEEMIDYACEDVEYLEKIYKIQLEKLTEQKQLRVLELENKLIPVIVSMRINGIKVDVDKWQKAISGSVKNIEIYKSKVIDDIILKVFDKYKFETAFDAMELLKIPRPKGVWVKNIKLISDRNEIEKFIRDNININSNTQMLFILTDIYGIKIKDTNEHTINKFNDIEIINNLIKYRGYEKEVSGFSEGYLSKINPKTGRLHPNYNQLGAKTGRFSSSNPNMQNIKNADEEGTSKFRECFISEQNKYLISADYSQQELRLLADVTRDPKMLETFEKELDPHTVTATGLFMKEYDKITKQERKIGKSLNFAINYGTTEFGLERNFNIPKEEGKKNIENYFKFYTVYSKYVKVINDGIWERGYSSTLLGRKRFFDKKILFKDKENPVTYKEKTLRSLRNHVIQGSGADMTKTALINIFYNNPFGDRLKLLLQIHDEIVLECDKEIVDDAMNFVTEQMLKAEDCFLKIVKSKVEVKKSTYWEH